MGRAVSARFWTNGVGVLVFDRKTGRTVAETQSPEWAQMIADGLNLIIDKVTPWSPTSAYVDVLDGEVVDVAPAQKEIEA